MIKYVKKTHEEHVIHMDAWEEDWYDLQDEVNKEFKDMWRWRCPEKRRNFVVKWAMDDQWSCILLILIRVRNQ